MEHNPMVETRKVLIISGNPKEANHYAKLNGWTDWKYVSDVQSLYGISDVRIVFCGSHVYRYDRVRLDEMVDEMVDQGKAEVIVNFQRDR